MAIVLLLAFLSPASILAMERGNIDIIIFFLLSVSLVYISIPMLFTGIVLFASILKIFPIFAIVGLLKDSKKTFLTFFLLSIVIFTAYVSDNIEDIILIKKGTPQAISLSYGMNIAWMATQKFLGVTIGTIVKFATYFYIFVLFILVYRYLNKKKVAFLSIDKTYIDSFRVGSTIYLATFLLSNNWDYRLIFLIFTLPQFIVWINSSIKILKFTSILSVISIVVTMWYLDLSVIFNSKIAWLGDELSNWILFSSLLFLLILTLPGWVLELIKLSQSNEKATT